MFLAYIELYEFVITNQPHRVVMPSVRGSALTASIGHLAAQSGFEHAQVHTPSRHVKTMNSDFIDIGAI